ncbi:hypothetical protein [Streptomyces sp. SP18CS02]|uniref:hypothetical protein n=1 Tax=Streptomyces sp. SP18CS02 TaxID=3002531 RepID=UPI002E75F88A|nr:hypothetical protein [Streptomyces sp. SP18CS02]MEE1751738.1 hypothetical protein [Streptomyces sp. SP18CS02]
MNVRSGWLAPSGQTREDTRVTALGALTPESPVRTRSGILPGSADGTHRISGFTVSGASAMAATVFPGRAIVQGMDSQGAYPVALTQPTALTFADGHAQHDRVDLVVLRVYDDLYDGSQRAEAVVEVLQGTAAPVPAAPAVPGTALALYEVRVAAGASAGNGGIAWAAALTDRRTTTVALGGVLPVTGDSGNGAYPGQYRDLNGVLQRWDGARWEAYGRGIGGIAPAGAHSGDGYPGQYRDTATRLERWDGTLWRPAVPGPAYTLSNDAGYTKSTAFTDKLLDTPGTAMALPFTAPRTGGVLVTVGARIKMVTSSTAYGFAGAVVRRGTTVVSPANDDLCAVYAGSRYMSVTSTYRVTGLAAGAEHVVTALYRTEDAAVEAWFDTRYLRVDPLL